jgi:hypothetical protein
LPKNLIISRQKRVDALIAQQCNTQIECECEWDQNIV